MSIGTYQPTLFHRLGDAWNAFKGVPTPAALYPMQGRQGMQTTQPGFLSWPGWDEFNKRSQATNAIDEQNAKKSITNVWVYSACNAIASEFSAARLQVKQRDMTDEGESDVENHPLELLWENPNPFMGRAFLMQFWAWQLLLTGEAYLFLNAPGSEVEEIWPIPSFFVTPIPDPKKFISRYAIRTAPDKDPIPIDARYIIYSRLPNPFDIRRGLSPLVAALLEAEADLGMARWNKNFFSKENAAPTGVISIPKDSLDQDVTRVRMEMRDFFSDGQRRVAVARAGDITWQAFDRSQKDMEFLEGRRFSREAIYRAFGIPDGYFSGDANRANSESAKATMIEMAVWPKLVLLAEDLNAQLLGEWYEDDMRVEFDDIRPRNRALELSEFTAYQAVKTVDELRAMIHDEPIGDVRGLMLVAEIAKGTPLPATPASDQTEEAISAQEDAAGVGAPEEEAMTEEAAPAEEEPTEEEAAPAVDVFSKAVDLDRWERKALKALRAGKRAAVPFTSDVIDADTHARISAALVEAGTVAAVKAAFKGGVEDEIDAALTEALAWAQKAQE